MKTRFNFDVTSIEKCKESFMKAKEEMGYWDWHIGGYEALYNSQMKRLLKEKEQKEIEQNKRKKK